jgi:hypothetical protein
MMNVRWSLNEARHLRRSKRLEDSHKRHQNMISATHIQLGPCHPGGGQGRVQGGRYDKGRQSLVTKERV